MPDPELPDEGTERSREGPEWTVEQAEPPSSSATASQPWLNVMGSRYLLDWLAEQRISLAFTTYQTGKLFFVGRKPDQAISVFERTFNHCMGL